MSPNPATRKIIPALITATLVALLLAAGANAAVSTTYGEVVDERSSQTDPNSVVFHTDLIGTGLGRILYTDDATEDDEKNWYVDVDGTGGVTDGDIRLNTRTNPSFSAGTKVTTGNGDIGLTLLSADVSICYIPTITTATDKEYRGDDQLNPPNPASGFVASGEPVYAVVNTDCTGQPLSDGSRPIHLTPGPTSNPSLGGGSAGTVVTQSNQLTSSDLVALNSHHAAAQLRFVDMDMSDGISNADAIYISLANEDHPRPGDIRLFSTSIFNTGSGTGFGSYVQITHLDAEKPLTALPGTPALMFGPGDSPPCSGTTLRQTLYLSIDGSTPVEAGDIRVAVRSGGTGSHGSVVRPGDADEGDALTASGGTLKFRDNSNSNDFQYGDVLYLHLETTDKVEPEDIRLSEGGASGIGTCVASNANDRNDALSEDAASTGFHYLDAWNAGEYQQGNPVYVGPAGDVGIGHVRWYNHLSTFGSHGSWVSDNSRDRSYNMETWAGTDPALCFTPSSGSTYRLEDPVYLVRDNLGCTAKSLRPGDVRLTGTGTKAAGTTVRAGDHDFNKPLEELTTAKFMFSGSGGFDSDSEVYLKIGTGSTISIRDVRITGSSGLAAGSKVTSGSSDEGNSLHDMPTTFDLVNVKFLKQLPPSGTTYSDGFTPHDIVVYDENTNDLLDMGDIILIGSGGSSSLPGTSSGSNGGNPTTPSTNPTASFTTNVDGRLVVTNGQGSSANSGRSITNYAWDFGNGETSSGSNLVQATHTYEEEGEYTIRLTVTDNQGETGTTTRIIQTDDYVPPTDTETETDTDTDTDTETDTDTDTDTETEEEEQTPAPAALVVLAAIAVALVALRRRK